jgi:hypothetical protein
VKDNDTNGIALLLLDSDLHACGFCSFPKLREVLEPFGRSRRVSNVAWYDVKSYRIDYTYYVLR